MKSVIAISSITLLSLTHMSSNSIAKYQNKKAIFHKTKLQEISNKINPINTTKKVSQTSNYPKSSYQKIIIPAGSVIKAIPKEGGFFRTKDINKNSFQFELESNLTSDETDQVILEAGTILLGRLDSNKQEATILIEKVLLNNKFQELNAQSVQPLKIISIPKNEFESSVKRDNFKQNIVTSAGRSIDKTAPKAIKDVGSSIFKSVFGGPKKIKAVELKKDISYLLEINNDTNLFIAKKPKNQTISSEAVQKTQESSAAKGNILLEDKSPKKCDIILAGKPTKCNEFKLIQEGNTLYFTFLVEKSPISFIVLRNPLEAKEKNVSTLKTHGGNQIFIGGKVLTSKSISSCVFQDIKPKYRVAFDHLVICQDSSLNIKIDYQGKPAVKS